MAGAGGSHGQYRAAGGAAGMWLTVSANAAVVYTNDFATTEVGKIPADFMILDGQFTVQEFEGTRVLELPGAPLDTFGILFGPTEADGLAVSARVQGTATGRRLPSFGVALNGVAGYKLMVSAGKRALELNKGEETLTSTPYTWKPGQWTWMKLQVTKVKVNAWRPSLSGWKSLGIDDT